MVVGSAGQSLDGPAETHGLSWIQGLKRGVEESLKPQRRMQPLRCRWQMSAPEPTTSAAVRGSTPAGTAVSSALALRGQQSCRRLPRRVPHLMGIRRLALFGAVRDRRYLAPVPCWRENIMSACKSARQARIHETWILVLGPSWICWTSLSSGSTSRDAVVRISWGNTCFTILVKVAGETKQAGIVQNSQLNIILTSGNSDQNQWVTT